MENENSGVSNFDPDKFLDMGTETAGVRRPPIASGLSFLGTIGEPKARVNQGKAGGPNEGKTYVFCDVPITLDLSTSPAEVQRVGVDKVTLRHGFSMDLDTNGELDFSPGKNRVLTAYREILGLNQDGVKFTPRHLVGRIVRAKVKHRTNEGEVYDDIDSVAKP
jgi:hypothetical protein